MHHQVLVHVVWTTRDREPSLDRERAAYLWERLPIIARQERGRILELGVVASHLHLLIRLHPMTQLPRMLQRMKGGTAYGINGGASTEPNRLRWAKGYSVISVSPRAAPRVAVYVRNQHFHHPDDAIPGWDNPHVALATPAESRLQPVN